MTLQVRVASLDDAPLLAPLVYNSGSNSLDAMFTWDDEHTALGFLGYALTKPHGQFGYLHHVVLTQHSETLATGCCWSSEVSKGFQQATLDSLLAYFGHERTAWVLERSKLIAEVIPPPKASELTLGHISVAPAKQRQGLASKLMQYFEQRAQQQGFIALVLDVEAHNQAALSLYQRQGFSVVSKAEPSEAGKAVGLTPHLHLRKDLL